MANLDLTGLLGTENKELAVANLTKVFLKPLDSVLENEENPFEMTGIEELMNNIEEQGLEEPLTGYLNKENKVVLYSGHRRLLALTKLYQQGRSYGFHGKDITGSVPVLIQDKISDKNVELMKIIGANNHRDLSKEEKERIIDISLEVIDKTYGTGRSRSKINDLTGISENFIKTYLSNKNKVRKKASSEPMEEEKSPLISLEKKIMKTLEKALELSDQYLLESNELLDEESLNQIREYLKMITANFNKK